MRTCIAYELARSLCGLTANNFLSFLETKKKMFQFESLAEVPCRGGREYYGAGGVVVGLCLEE